MTDTTISRRWVVDSGDVSPQDNRLAAVLLLADPMRERCIEVLCVTREPVGKRVGDPASHCKVPRVHPLMHAADRLQNRVVLRGVACLRGKVSAVHPGFFGLEVTSRVGRECIESRRHLGIRYLLQRSDERDELLVFRVHELAPEQHAVIPVQTCGRGGIHCVLAKNC